MEEITGDSGDTGLIPRSGRSSGGGNGNPLQYSCPENPWTEELGQLQSIALQRVGHDWATDHVCHEYYFSFNSFNYLKMWKPFLAHVLYSNRWYAGFGSQAWFADSRFKDGRCSIYVPEPLLKKLCLIDQPPWWAGTESYLAGSLVSTLCTSLSFELHIVVSVFLSTICSTDSKLSGKVNR